MMDRAPTGLRLATPCAKLHANTEAPVSKAPRVPPQRHRQLQQQQQQQSRNSTTVTTSVREAPLPAPDELFQYEKLTPGLADRIVAMAEREQAHRMNIEDMTARADIAHRNDVMEGHRLVSRGTFISDALGQTFGWIIAGACVGGAIFTAYIQAHPTIPIALVSLPVASMIKAIRATRKDDSK